MTELQRQIETLVEAFATDDEPLTELWAAISADVARGMAEPLQIFPVAHHSPAAALQMVRRLRAAAPRVIYIELCEDLLEIVPNLRDCKLPVALQAFAAESQQFAPDKMPLNLVAPLTESSAEYQAIAYTLEHPETELVFVDRATDFAFLWDQKDEPAEDVATADAGLHGDARGVELGNMLPTFGAFLDLLLQNSRTRHYSEWWAQYVEAALLDADYATYRQIMFLMGSLIRRIGRRGDNSEDEMRERYMWTRIKQHMATNGIKPHEAIHICGAAHTATSVAEFGTDNNLVWDIPERMATTWQYGLLPSSFAAIEAQFGLASGTVQLADSSWQKGLRAKKLRPFTLKKRTKSTKAKAKKKSKKSPAVAVGAQPVTTELDEQALIDFLQRSPALEHADDEQLLGWCVRVVALARKNGYLASTADSIAIYQTAMLLANLRDRAHPTPYDFTDAAITCLEKDRRPKKRDIAQICGILLGGDRIGTVGYASLPPLAQNIYDRLTPLGVNLLAKTNQRALVDYRQNPELLPCSEVLWRIHFLCGEHVVTPIMGERTLEHKPLQESWEIRIGKYQTALIQLGYEGVTLEQVLAQRLQKQAFKDDATASSALEAAENSLKFLKNGRLSAELGFHAANLLLQETGVDDAPAVFRRVRRLVHHFRSSADGLPEWIETFVATGYAHYATLLPQAFADRGTSPEKIAAMLNFIFTLESLALALGCERSQLLIAVQQVDEASTDASKVGLLWTTEWLLQLRSLDQIREFLHDVLQNPLRIAIFPDYLNGFMLALEFARQIGRFLVELVSMVFASVPDHILMPWLPSLIVRLRSQPAVVQMLVREVALTFPSSLDGFDSWTPPWEATEAESAVEVVETAALSADDAAIRALLFGQRATAEATATLLGVESLEWVDAVVVDVGAAAEPSAQLLEAYPATLTAAAQLIVA